VSGGKTAVVRSYAKINLSLDILGKRPDGYHAIESVMQTISLHDTLTLTFPDGSGDIRVTCDMPGIPTDESNLAYRAAALFFERMGIEPALDIHIEKRIPPEAGLGGGSSNAAAVLRALNRSLFTVDCSLLAELAAQVGSDVPFFLIGGTAFVRGRGEVIQPLPDIEPWRLVIVKPPFGISTAWAYRRLDELGASREQPTASERMRNCIEKEGVSTELDTGCRELPRLLGNDLELPAIERHPEIGDIKKALMEAGACGSLMCGSGSAVFGLFEDEETARRASTKVADLGQVFVETTIGREESMGVWACGRISHPHTPLPPYSHTRCI
jgi:4-diphosphocytidyl-2-C-methyl-D-erythritol kinase